MGHLMLFRLLIAGILLKNLRDALKQLLESKRACLRAAAEEPKEESKQNESTQEKTSPKHIEQTQKVIVSKPSTEEPADTPKLTKAEKQRIRSWSDELSVRNAMRL